MFEYLWITLMLAGMAYVVFLFGWLRGWNAAWGKSFEIDQKKYETGMDYDANLGEITVQDREYALDLMAASRGWARTNACE